MWKKMTFAVRVRALLSSGLFVSIAFCLMEFSQAILFLEKIFGSNPFAKGRKGACKGSHAVEAPSLRLPLMIS
jgi:hypothetical protein